MCWFWILLGLLLLLPTPVREILRPGGGERAATTTVTQTARTPGAPAQVVRLSGAAEQLPIPTVEPIEDPRQSMRFFYHALSRTKARAPGAITRVLHYGDSLIDFDLISGDLRQRLQGRYGDAGHGFTLAAKPWRWYNQRGLSYQEQAETWDHFRLVGGRVRDGRLGLGCAAVESHKEAWAQIATTTAAPFSRLVLHFLQQPGGGRLRVVVDGQVVAKLSTAEKTIRSGFYERQLDDKPHTIRLRASKAVRVFGLALERRGPGITWENLPLISARFNQLAFLDETHWHEQLAQRRPDLLVFQFGANDTISYGGDLEQYGQQILELLRRLRRQLPRASCLVIGPLDRLERDVRGGLHTPKTVQIVVNKQRAVALQAHCAFWDGLRAMGGKGAMISWLEKGEANKDMVHLNGKGAQRLALLLEKALEEGFRRQARPPAPKK